MNLKFAIAQIATDPGDIAGNTSKIINYIEQAKKNKADVVIFPELSIPGYMALDLMLYDKYVKENLKALQKIKSHSKNILIVVGFINSDLKTIGPDGTKVRYNSAAILFNKKVLAIVNKTLLPDYDVFFENRYFKSGAEREIIKFKGINLGIQICEDLWDKNYPNKISEELVEKGADVLINISGSPFYVGKKFDREKLIKKVVTKYKVPFIYANTVGCQDGYDGELIFDGQSMVFGKSGKLKYLAKSFEEEMFYVNWEELFLDLTRVKKTKKYSEIEEITQALTLGIKDYFRRTNFKKAYIGLSGGIDSAVVAVLAVRALGKEQVTGIFMPSDFSSKESLDDSKKLAKNLGINFLVIPIKKPYSEFNLLLKKQFGKLPFNETEENIQARARGIILMAHANKFNGLVISTANKTETALGYATLYGDMCGAIAPLADVSKLQVYAIANYINKNFQEKIPREIIEKVPTAELRFGQSDEASLGGSYSVISPMVDEIVEDFRSAEQLTKKYPPKLVNKIIKLIDRSEYKRRQASPAIKITKKAFGIGRRIPNAHKFHN